MTRTFLCLRLLCCREGVVTSVALNVVLNREGPQSREHFKGSRGRQLYGPWFLFGPSRTEGH